MDVLQARHGHCKGICALSNVKDVVAFRFTLASRDYLREGFRDVHEMHSSSHAATP
jgi:hypothetical protein